MTALGSQATRGEASSEHPRGRYADWPDGWYKVNGRYVKVYNGRTQKVQASPPTTRLTPAPTTTTTSGGGGGGGGGGGDPKKPYLNYYTRILNIKPNLGLVAQAAKENYTMQEFQLLVQRQDTARFLKTALGQQAVSNFRTMWARIFPQIGAGPSMRALKQYLQQKPAKGVKATDITNPTSMRDMYTFLSKTKLFKKVYPEFEHTQFAQTLDFSGYRQYKSKFRQILASYTGTSTPWASPEAISDVSYFFRSNISPEEFERNLSTMMTGGEAYQYATGQAMQPDVAKRAIYNRPGAAQTLAKVAAAYQAREGFMKARPGDYAIERENETGRIVQRSAY